MAEKQSILGRIAQITKANINALLDKAEDPEKLLDQLVRDYTNEIAEAEQAVAQTIGNLRLAERDRDEDQQAATDWGAKAAAASKKADELRAAGNAAEADKMDNLAKVAITKQISFEKEVEEAAPIIASQTATVDKLKSGLNTMKMQLEELKSKRDSLVARSKTAATQTQVQQAVSRINIMDPTSELGRFEEKVRRAEAMAAGQAELAGESESLEEQFAALDVSAADAEVAARLNALKSNG